MEKLFKIPEDIGALHAAALQKFIDETTAKLAEVGASPSEFVNDDRTFDALKAEVTEAGAAVKEAREALAAFEAEETAEPEAEVEATEEPAEGAEDEPEAEESPEVEVEAEAEPEAEIDAAAAAAEIAELAAEAGKEEEPKPIVAAATPARRKPPARARSAEPQDSPQLVPLVAAAGAGDVPLGAAFPDMLEVAKSMINRRRQFGNNMPDGAENVTIAASNWSDLYPEGRHFRGLDEESTAALIAAAVDDRAIRAAFKERAKKHGGDAFSLVASGGLCAPVTPYYNLQMISVAERPVRAALPAFNADRGGIRAAQPASLAAITTGVGSMTAADDAAGGTTGTKSCQTVDCPDFFETDVEILFHCLRFGNLGARTFPERVAQWNNLVLAAHARLGDRTLLTGIDTASTAVTAASLGLGASADLLSQVLTAAAGMRSRHRMDPEAVLRVMLPQWVVDLIVSDVYRSQFGRWDMTPQKFVALLRQGNVEPTFYIDSAAGKGQEFGVQSAGALLPFPSTVSWYLYPEGSFLYLDGGILELGLVRDSILNSTNDFEIFGESFENVAFIGVESLAITSTLCDSGVTAGTHNTVCPISYEHSS
jgi:hypothetical protein